MFEDIIVLFVSIIFLTGVFAFLMSLNTAFSHRGGRKRRRNSLYTSPHNAFYGDGYYGDGGGGYDMGGSDCHSSGFDGGSSCDGGGGFDGGGGCDSGGFDGGGF